MNLLTETIFKPLKTFESDMKVKTEEVEKDKVQKVF